MGSTLSAVEGKLLKYSNLSDEEIETLTSDMISSKCHKLKSKEEDITSSLVSVAKNLKAHLRIQGQAIETLKRDSASSQHADDFALTQYLETRVSDIENWAANLSISDEKAIKCFNLGFLSKGKSDAWLDLRAPRENFVFIVNFHTLLEHINQAIT